MIVLGIMFHAVLLIDQPVTWAVLLLWFTITPLIQGLEPIEYVECYSLYDYLALYEVNG